MEQLLLLWILLDFMWNSVLFKIIYCFLKIMSCSFFKNFGSKDFPHLCTETIGNVGRKVIPYPLMAIPGVGMCCHPTEHMEEVLREYFQLLFGLKMGFSA